MSVQCSLEQVQRMVDFEYAKYKPYTVADACKVLSELGYGSTRIFVEGYDNRRRWTFDLMKSYCYIYHPRIGTYVDAHGLSADNLLVQWKGGPPRDRRTFQGSLLMCLIDFVLYKAAINNEITNAVQALTP